MNRPDGTDKTFEVLRELPAEVTIEQVGRMVATFPLLGAAGSWFSHINLNSILMTSTGAIIIAASVYLYSPQEPKANAVRTPEPSPVPEAVVSPPPVVEAPAVTAAVVAPRPERSVKNKAAAPAVAAVPAAPTKPMIVVMPPAALGPLAAAAPATFIAALPSSHGPNAMPGPAPEDDLDLMVKERQFDLRGFTGVAVHGSMDVVVERGDFSVSAEGDPGLVDLLEVTVKDNMLSITTRKDNEHKGSRGWNRSAIVKVKMPTLDRLDLAGSGDIRAEAFSGGKLDVQLRGSGDIAFTTFQGLSTLSIQLDGSGDIVGNGVEVSGMTRIALAGSGDVRLEGRTGTIEVKVVGSGDVGAGSFPARTGDVQVIGSGDVHVNCSGTLNRKITGSGDIHNTGSADGEGSN